MMLDKMANESSVSGGEFQGNKSNDSSVVPGAAADGAVLWWITYSKYYIPPIFALIFVVGVIGNGSLLYIFGRKKAMRTIPNILIFNLALGDLFVLLFTVPFTSTIYTSPSWPYGSFICTASEFAKDTSVGVSIFSLTALSFDRYKVIVRPVESYVSGSKYKTAIVLLSFIWILSLGMALPAALFTHLLPISSTNETIADDNGTLITRETVNYVCYPFPNEFGPIYPQMIVLIRFIFQYVLPLVTIGTFYSLMSRHLLDSVRPIPGLATTSTTPTASAQQPDTRHPPESPWSVMINERVDLANPLQQQQQSPKQSRTRRKLVKLMMLFVVLFAVCYLPNHIYMFWFYFDIESPFTPSWLSFKTFGFVIFYANSCINPVALYYISSSFRKHINQLLCCCCRSAPSAP